MMCLIQIYSEKKRFENICIESVFIVFCLWAMIAISL